MHPTSAGLIASTRLCPHLTHHEHLVAKPISKTGDESDDIRRMYSFVAILKQGYKQNKELNVDLVKE